MKEKEVDTYKLIEMLRARLQNDLDGGSGRVNMEYAHQLMESLLSLAELEKFY